MMPSLSSLVTTLTLACGVITSPSAQLANKYAVKSSHHVPRDWKRVAPAPADLIINLQIGLRQGKADEVLQTLKEVSDPRHPRYGQHLSNAEVTELVKPTLETSRLVDSWLTEHGISPHAINHSPAGDWLSLSLPIHKANRLLGCHYSVYEHQDENVKLVRTPEWSLPEYLHDHVDLIEPTNSFIRPLKREAKSTARVQHLVPDDHADLTKTLAKREARSTAQLHHMEPVDEADLAKVLAVQAAGPNDTSVATLCQETLVSTDCLRALYRTINYKPKASSRNRMAIANYLGETTLKSDLNTYLQEFRPDIPDPASASDFKIISYDNGTTQQTPLTPAQVAANRGVEGNMDVQLILGMGWPAQLISYSTGGTQPGFKADNWSSSNNNEPYLVWVTKVLALDDSELPYVVSTSYEDNEQTVSKEYAEKVCQAFATLGTRGVSLLFGSGDWGVGQNGDCFANEPPYKRKFLPMFPSSCPWITSVGATYKFNPEVAVEFNDDRVHFYSGGGFSEYFKRPEYQEKAVSAYLAKNKDFSQYEGLFNKEGRAYPDIAAQGLNLGVIWNNKTIRAAGTSAATPLTAGIIANINDALLSSGKKPLGFLNPWIYQGGYKAFNDILIGKASGCEVDGFTCGPEWDAVTGWGTPDFLNILENLGIGHLDDLVIVAYAVKSLMPVIFKDIRRCESDASNASVATTQCCQRPSMEPALNG
ncbi:hypothetical protein FKW77_007609 [Venturia effusa]|uniref:tripeptidyl-peptidase II n=1 Tax=Venturia effusa TaxID=50376 RepID=A0A517L1M5_9PEZI|nr:hypothetical protein FKW77_007609 [Venturia effusa]